MKRINTTCKICVKPISMDCDEAGLAFLNESVWIKKIACNRCSDYKVGLRKTVEAVYSVCQLLRGCRQNMAGQARLQLESKVREKLATLTKRFCYLVCAYHRVTNVWDQAVPDMIFDNPDRAAVAMSVYIKAIAKESVTA